MKKIFSLFVFLGFFAVFSLPMSFAESYENQEYGFEIDFPSGWYADEYLITYEPLPGYYEGSADFVGFYDDENWPNHSINIGFVKNYFIAENYGGQEYLDRIEIELTEVCQTATLEFDGYACTDHKIIESKMIEIAGYDAYQVTESWTETYGDQSTFGAIGTSIDIPVGNNVWTIYSFSLDSEYPLVQNQINDSINSFKLTNGGVAPDLEYAGLDSLDTLTSLFQPITSHYVNSEVGLEINFPENWQGIQMQFPKELFENLDSDEFAEQYPDEFQEQLMELLSSSTIVMVLPEDMVTGENNSETINMSMLFIVDVSAVENLAETAGQLTSMSSSPDSFYGGAPSESNLDDCDFNSSKVILVNEMTAYEIAAKCMLSEMDQNMEMLMYMFGTEEHLIMVMHLNTSNSDQLSSFSEFERSLDSLVIDGIVDISDPQIYSEMFDMTIDTKTVQSNNMSHDITIVSNTSISDFAFDEQNGTVELMLNELDNNTSLGYMDIHLDNSLGKSPFYVTIDGKELEVFVIDDTISDKTILSLEYLLPADKITVSNQHKALQQPTADSIPDWVKSTAGWWANGDVDDASFIQGIKFMIEENIIVMPETVENSGLVSDEIPDWVKSTAGWWANGDVDDASFIQGIQFMVENGIISLN